MSGDEIKHRRNLRIDRSKTRPYTSTISITETKLVWRLHGFPDEYSRVVQTLLSQKKLGVVFR